MSHFFMFLALYISVMALRVKNGIYMKNRTFKKKKKGPKSDNFEILGHSDLQGHVTTLKVSKLNSGEKI